MEKVCHAHDNSGTMNGVAGGQQEARWKMDFQTFLFSSECLNAVSVNSFVPENGTMCCMNSSLNFASFYKVPITINQNELKYSRLDIY